MDPSWSETGDRYLLKLFRDYLFHQVTENGAPWVDLAHIVACLNKVSHLVNQIIFGFFLLSQSSRKGYNFWRMLSLQVVVQQ